MCSQKVDNGQLYLEKEKNKVLEKEKNKVKQKLSILVISRVQIEATLRFHFNPIRMVVVRKKNAGRYVGKSNFYIP